MCVIYNFFLLIKKKIFSIPGSCSRIKGIKHWGMCCYGKSNPFHSEKGITRPSCWSSPYTLSHIKHWAGAVYMYKRWMHMVIISLCKQTAQRFLPEGCSTTGAYCRARRVPHRLWTGAHYWDLRSEKQSADQNYIQKRWSISQIFQIISTNVLYYKIHVGIQLRLDISLIPVNQLNQKLNIRMGYLI